MNQNQPSTDLPYRRYPTSEGHTVRFFEASGERLTTVEPKGSWKATVVWVHGLSDHAARQLDSARRLADHGYRTILFDLNGHGGSALDRRSSFWIVQAYLENDSATAIADAIRLDPRFTRKRQDQLDAGARSALSKTRIDDHLRQLHRVLSLLPRLPGADSSPLLLVGHSMGALIVAESLWRSARWRMPGLGGAALLSPALQPQGNPDSLAERLAVEALWSRRDQRFSLARSAAKTVLATNIDLDTSWGDKWLSDQDDEVALYRTDPLVPRQLPSAYASSIESQMVRTAARGDDFPTDGLVMIPGRDGITNRDAGSRFARRAMGVLGPNRFELASFDEVCAHDLMRSSVRDQARAVLVDWLDAKVSASSRRARGAA